MHFWCAELYAQRTALSFKAQSAGKIEIGLSVPDLEQFHIEMSSKGVQFPMAPQRQDFGGMLAQFLDSEGAPVSVSGS